MLCDTATVGTLVAGAHAQQPAPDDRHEIVTEVFGISFHRGISRERTRILWEFRKHAVLFCSGDGDTKHTN
jgi:hypothetical protein